MTQLNLGVAVVAKWERLSSAGDKCSAHWRHVSGWEVKHCGHPTANYPYHGVDLEGRMIVATNGRGFINLQQAKDAVESASEGLADGWRYPDAATYCATCGKLASWTSAEDGKPRCGVHSDQAIAKRAAKAAARKASGK